MKEDSLNDYKVESDAIFINQATWYLIAQHFFTQNVEVWNHNKICEESEIHSYNNDYKTY